MNELKIILKDLLSAENKWGTAPSSASTHFNAAITKLLELCPEYETDAPDFLEIIESAIAEIWLYEATAKIRKNLYRLGTIKAMAEESMPSTDNPGLIFVMAGHLWGQEHFVTYTLKGLNIGHFQCADGEPTTRLFVESQALIAYCEAKAKTYDMDFPFVTRPQVIQIKPIEPSRRA